VSFAAEDVIDILSILEAAGVQAWLDGGWGVDALLKEQTRSHADLDIVVDHQDVDLLIKVLTRHGFVIARVDSAFNAVLADARGRHVDYHVVDLQMTRTVADGTVVYGPRGLAYDVGSLEGVGLVAGRTVGCCTPSFQAKSHAQGYEPDEDDYRDVLALHRRFGTPLLPPYDTWQNRHDR
jgi:lincosamide nucleotidyltransferase A/C/D/E